MSNSPGAMFNAEGVSLDPAIPDLTEEKLDEYPHRSMVARPAAAGRYRPRPSRPGFRRYGRRRVPVPIRVAALVSWVTLV